MIDAILFPCEMFSLKQVDSCFQKEFDAVTKNGNFEIIFYDYEKFAESGNLCLNKKVENTIYAMLRGWMLNDNQYRDFYEKLISKNIRLITSPEQYCKMHLFPNIYPQILHILIHQQILQLAKMNLANIFQRFSTKQKLKISKMEI